MTEISHEREISPFVDDAENIRCPSCDKPSSFQELNVEGGADCGGCGRTIQLQIQTKPQYGEWRNVPQKSQEDYR